MTQQTLARQPEGLRALLQPRYRRDKPGPPWWRPVWSVPAAWRAVRATLVIPILLAVTFEVIGNAQMAIFAVFGSFGALILTTFGGSRRDKLVAHFGLAVAGSISLTIGTLAGGSALVAALVTLPVAFGIFFAGMAGPNAAFGVNAVLLAYILPVASGGGAGEIPPRLAGWWLASAASTAAVMALSPPSSGDRLRQSAGALARTLGQLLQAGLDGTATASDREATLTAKHNLMTLFDATPYRPVGLAIADQSLANLISLLEWCTTLTFEALDGHLEFTHAPGQDQDLLAQSAAALRAIADLLAGGENVPDIEAVWNARLASATHLRGLTGDPAVVRELADHAFHAQAIGVTVSAASADAVLAARRLDPDLAEAQRRRWLAAPSDETGGRTTDPAALPPQPRSKRLPLLRAAAAISADASIRSLWFRNSARGAAALAVAVGVARLTGVQHAFWVVLGTLSVLRSSAGATGSTALRALAGTVLGFVIGGALLIGIGTSPVALWIALPIAVLVAAYSPGTAPFAVGQAAFTVTVVVLFNLLAPAGWQVGLLRVEDVAIGCAVSVVVGLLFWPRGASALVGDNLADALRAGSAYFTEATRWVLGLPEREPWQAEAAVAASIRLDGALRGFLTEQGSKRIDKQDLWTLAMSALRLRLTAHSLASLPGLEASRGPAAAHPIGAAVRDSLVQDSRKLTDFYEQVAGRVDRPGRGKLPVSDISLPGPVSGQSAEPCRVGPAHFHPEALWIRDHLTHLGSHSAAILGPASRLAALRRTPWWR
jgi:uncharacterized membrane protein YccC